MLVWTCTFVGGVSLSFRYWSFIFIMLNHKEGKTNLFLLLFGFLMYFRNLLIWRAQFPYPQLLSPVNYLFWRLCGKWERRNVFVSIQWYADKDIHDASQSGLNFFEFCKLPRCGVLGQNTPSGLVGWSQSSIKRSQLSFPSCLETTSLVSRIYWARTRSLDDVIYCSVRQIAQNWCQCVKSLPTLPIDAFDDNDSILN